MDRLLRLFSKSPRGLAWLLLLFKLKPLAPGLDLRYETGTLKTCSYRSGRVTADGLPFAAAFLCIGQAARVLKAPFPMRSASAGLKRWEEVRLRAHHDPCTCWSRQRIDCSVLLKTKADVSRCC